MMHVQNKDTFKNILLTLGMVVCLFLALCRDESAEHFIRGNAHLGSDEYDKAIADFNKIIEINPRDANAYKNRGVAYCYKGEYDKAWDDVHKAQSLGYQAPPEFLKALREASGREE
jgi:tetratricopeptide (TPR) repeat protein